MLSRRTNVAAHGIGILTSRAEVDGCWLLMVNRRTVAALSCAHSSTQGAGSLPMISSLFLEWMERSQGGMRRLSPAARPHQAKRAITMYRRPVGLLLSCLAVPVLNGNPYDFKNDPTTFDQRYYKPFNSHVCKSSYTRASIA